MFRGVNQIVNVILIFPKHSKVLLSQLVPGARARCLRAGGACGLRKTLGHPKFLPNLSSWVSPARGRAQDSTFTQSQNPSDFKIAGVQGLSCAKNQMNKVPVQGFLLQLFRYLYLYPDKI